MRLKILTAISFLLITGFSIAAGDQEKLEGIWEGKLIIQGMPLRLVFNFNMNEGKLEGTLDSPDQGAKGISISEIIVNNDSIRVEVPSVKGYYEGKVDYDSLIINGTWHQAGMSLPLQLKKTDKVEEVKRPQTPKEPFPYNVEEIEFRNEVDKITLSGTLTTPRGIEDYPVVILVTGSGPQDRDETVMNHKPFWVIADNLTRNGIGVLRYDDRGTAKSEGEFSTATTLDFVKDADAAVKYLRSRKEFRYNFIGMIGHSEGALIAPIASNENDEIDFIVLLAGPALPGDEILRLQSELIAKAEGDDDETVERDLDFSQEIYSILKSDMDSSEVNEEITTLFRDYFETLTDTEKEKIGNLDVFLAQNLRVISSPWFRYFVSYDPLPALEKINVPVLALYGEKDLQVPPGENIKVLESVLKDKNSKNKIVQLPGLNHLFQNAVTGSPTEYATIEETFSKEAIRIIVEWIHSLDKY